MTPAFDAITPHPDGVDADDELIHERAYVVRAYRSGVDKLVLRGAVRDQKPPGLYFDDTQPLTVHHMIVDLTIAIPSLEITAAKAVLEIHPHPPASGSRITTTTSSGCRLPAASPTRFASCSAGRVDAPTRPPCCKRWHPSPIQSMWSFNMAQAQSDDDQQSVQHAGITSSVR